MATLRMYDLFEEEAQRRPSQLSIRNRQVIRNILQDSVATEDSLTVDKQISTYLNERDLEHQHTCITQNDNKWLKVNVHLGEYTGCETNTKRTTYEFKQRHPSNPLPENHDQPR